MKVCMVLEGGAMRGIYTAAVLDKLLDYDLKVNGIIGVSAGALFGMNFCSKQRGRVLRYNLKYCNYKNYMGLHSLITTGNIVNEKFCFHDLPNKLDVFDAEQFKKSNIDFYVTITNVKTGEAEYVKSINPLEEVSLYRATGAMPFVSQIVKYNDNLYLDGALSDSIPVKKAFDMGYDKVIVVLTKPKGYYKRKHNGIIAQTRYKEYPKLVEDINNRYKVYNNTINYINELEKNKKIFVFRPSKKIKFSRLEKNLDRINELYDLGISDVEKNINSLKQYLKK